MGGEEGEASFLLHSVICIEILGFPKIGIQTKPQRNFQTDVTKLMLEHRETV